MTTTQTFGALRGPLVDKDGNPSRDFLKKLQEYETKLANTITLVGKIASGAVIQGRTEGIGTTVQNVDSSGVVLAPGVDFVRAYPNKNTDNISDGTGSPLTGGKRGFQALDTNSRLTSTFNNNAVNVSVVPTSSTLLSNDGISTSIPISASTGQFGAGTRSYNSGSVDPGSFGTWYVFADDPTYAGGAVTFQFSSTPVAQSAADGRILWGKIITAGGTPKTGGGFSGGTTPGGAGGRSYVA